MKRLSLRYPVFLLFCLTIGGLNQCKAQVPENLEKEITFHCPFDNSLEPAIHSGAGTFHESIWPFFVSGHRGAAYVTGNRRNVRYALPQNINIEQGTVAFWVMPLNWKSSDQTFHHFFAVPNETGKAEATPGETGVFSFLVYKFPDMDELFAYGMDGQLGGSTLLRLPMAPAWVPGAWRHVAFCWDSTGAALYVDGQGLTMRYTRAAPRVAGSTEFQIGGPYFVRNLSLTAIDDLYIFNRKLTNGEVVALFREQNR